MSAAVPRSPAELAAAAQPTSRVVRVLKNRLFLGLCLAMTTLAVAILIVLLISIWSDGHGRLSMDFLTSYASRKPAEAGIKAPLWGSVAVCLICALTALPIGVCTAV